MGNKKDLTGQKFGMLTVTKMIYGVVCGERRRTMCECECDCGNKVTVRAENIQRPGLHSCGCAKKEIVRKACGKEINVGQRFGRLTVLKVLWHETPVRVKCLCDCGNIFTPLKSDVASGHTQSCGCLQKDRAGESNTVDYTDIVSPHGVKFLRRAYKNKKNQWVWECECPLCGASFFELPSKVMNGHTTSCGCLIQSNGEKLIAKILEDNNINFVPQYKDDRCIHIRKLEFDFAIYKNGELFYLIEYDGKQHFEPIEHFGGEEYLKITQLRDSIKNQFCQDYNIPLLRIPYTLTDEEVKQQIINII